MKLLNETRPRVSEMQRFFGVENLVKLQGEPPQQSLRCNVNTLMHSLT